MTHDSLIDWQDAFANADYIPDGMQFPEIWETRAAAFRKTYQAEFDLAYGPSSREVLDLFLPRGQPKGLAVIVHGGYWLAFDKSSWSDLAQGAVELGWAVAMPSYTLAPDASVPQITGQIAKAITFAANRIDGPVRLTGHSAGGHLVSRMACQDTPLAKSIQERIERVVSISGVHDLRPLLLHSMNDTLNLTPDTARAESPALAQAVSGIEVTAWVGAHERPEFLRQSALLAENWRQQGVKAHLVADPNRHHFDVIDGLKHADHPLTQAFAGD